ncbi:RNA polymerase sigma factor SigI [Neobacillus sp. OS1-32]|jgi:RNA polymerase sigma factor|uniref:RNA polymerase sigma factor SigI n=1 Tax=Neobacillus paridis TaxID=2803862 RepID=A0ABS1TMC4_9BACI|nr:MULTISPECIES: RNA polymerase sigma factor SigI [Neobacillus]MBL4952463.1 RNA polymerase sigma factor SigI [Neobacillus paridis]WML32011.1 RNA polymerase sigma factor SigI [Neobacillus sp. OS1-32]
MLGLLFMAKKKKLTLEETVALIQQGNSSLLNELIDAYKPFIAKTVSSVCKRYIYETDDEFSIGLIAFHEAIEKYSPERGSSLLSFAEVIIKRRIIDYIRKQTKNQHLSMDLMNHPNEEDSPGDVIVNELSLEDYHKKNDEQLRKEEIIRFQGLLVDFDLNLSDLLENSPKHADARKNAILVAKTLVEDQELKWLLLEKKRLPIKQLEKKVSVSRKTIERNRKYIIAIALILSGDFIYMKDYLKGVLET